MHSSCYQTLPLDRRSLVHLDLLRVNYYCETLSRALSICLTPDHSLSLKALRGELLPNFSGTLHLRDVQPQPFTKALRGELLPNFSGTLHLRDVQPSLH